MSLAPLVADGKVMVGASGGELGVRGFVAAFDVETGKPVWKTYTVPAPGEPGSETWPAGGDQWKTGGGSIWVTANYDAESNLAYWGTGNGGPWMGDQRPGDNLYTSSTVAIDVRTGAIKGHFQYDPNESWDWDEVSPPILVDYRRGNRTVRGLIDVARDGYLWFLERTPEGPDQVRRCDEPREAERLPQHRSEDRPSGCRPGAQARHRQARGVLSIALGREELAADRVQSADAPDLRPGEREHLRLDHRPRSARTRLARRLSARRRRRFPIRTRITSAKCRRGTSTPASACGRTLTRRRQTGGRCWRQAADWYSAAAPTIDGSTRSMPRPESCCGISRPQSGILGQPTTFMVDGTQYVAVQSGWGVDSRAMQARLNATFPGKYPEVPEGGSVWVFAVK